MKPSTPRRGSHRAHLTLFLGGFAGLLVLGLSLWMHVQQAAQVRSAAGMALQSVARAAAQALGSGLELSLHEAKVLAAAEDLWAQGLDRPEAGAALARHQSLREGKAWIGVADLQGRVRQATGGLLLGRDVSDRPWFSAGLKGAHVGDVHPAQLLASLLPAPADGETLRFVDFAAPIVVNGRPLGVLGIHGNWAWTARLLDQMLPPAAREAGIELLVYNRHGELIQSPGGLRSGGRDKQISPAGLQALSGQGPQVSRWADGLERLSVVLPLSNPALAETLGWQVVARQDLAQADAALATGTRQVLTVGLLISALAAAAIGWISGHLTEPLRQIAAVASRIEAGALALPMPQFPKGSRELDELARALDSMKRRLFGLHQAMEAQVLERTQALERANAELAHLSQTDPLTQLLNRRGLEPRLQQALVLTHRHRGALCLLLIDIDHFKRVNDLHGHTVGDRVLLALADQLRSGFRAADIVARLGGEEFLVVLTDNGTHRAQRIAQALVDSVAQRDFPEVKRVTLSIGVAGTDAVGFDAEALIHAADQALYEAKRGGRNRVACFPLPAGPVRSEAGNEAASAGPIPLPATQALDPRRDA